MVVTLRRVPNWDIALHLWAMSLFGKPYVWGGTDCGSLVRAAHEIMYGVDLLADVKPYDSLRAAVERHAETGGIEASLRAIGAVDVRPGFAQRGDILISDDGDSFECAGVVLGKPVLLATTDGGVAMAPLRGRQGALLRVAHG